MNYAGVRFPRHISQVAITATKSIDNPSCHLNLDLMYLDDLTPKPIAGFGKQVFSRGRLRR